MNRVTRALKSATGCELVCNSRRRPLSTSHKPATRRENVSVTVPGYTSPRRSASSAAAPDEAAQEALVRRFVSSQSHSLQAQTSFARAFGLAEQVQLLEAERQALSSGSVCVDAMKKSVSVS